MQVSKPNAHARSQGQDASGRSRAIPVTRSRMIPSRARVVNEESPPIMRNYLSREEFFSLIPNPRSFVFVEKFEAVNVIFYSAVILGRVIREYIRHLCRGQRELVSSCGR